MLILVKSLKGLKCETRSVSSYKTFIGTCFYFEHRSKLLLQLLLFQIRIFLYIKLSFSKAHVMGTFYNPDCVSVSLIPVSNQNQKLENLLPKLLFLGTLSWLIFLAPINITFLSSSLFS